MFRKISILFDFSWTSRMALEWAINLGARFRSSVSVVHVRQKADDPGEIERRLLAEIARKKELLPAGADAPGVALRIHSGRTADALLAAIEADDPDLVLAGTHGQTGLLHVLLGSVAEKIVRHSPSPVLVVKRSAFWPPQRLLLPVSFEDDVWEETLLAGSELRATLGVSLGLIHVLEPPVPLAVPPEAAVAMPAFNAEEAVRRAHEEFAPLIERHRSLPLVPRVVVGQPAHEICREAARAGTDVILMPTHGRSGVSKFLLGSVAEQVVRYAPCNVLVFRPGRFRKS